MVLAQARHSKDKTYNIHEPEVSCIAKGKSHKPYEFGSKTSIAIIPESNVVVNASCLKGNPYDSKTLLPVLAQISEEIKNYLTGQLPTADTEGRVISIQ